MPALVTPIAADGSVDRAAHRHNVNVLAGAGVTGLLLGGSTGEGPFLEAGERGLLVEIARETMPQGFLLAGIAANSVRQATAQIDETRGADGALVVTPTWLLKTDAERVAFYLDVAEESPLPVWLYTVPSVTGYNLPVSLAAHLATHTNIVGIKDSSGLPQRIARLRRSVGEQFFIYAGATRSLLRSRAAGASGAITASSNYAWQLANQVMADPLSTAASDQEALGALATRIEAHGIAGTKAAAEATGLMAGHPRPPAARLPDAVKPEIAGALKEAGLLPS